ncbi:sigma-54 dependent transcriptional regulator [Halosquirtibacter xylanolyticus]|uniref:sigma-54 interaction domain-containing protein n=1 Tax=Halosquirtibacter xylanolyticus TaxID=3374599 RepID=UPI0037496527|nr:sigma-54 dependent transcriptional regulator [Prolixibacteraceae bacterium]
MVNIQEVKQRFKLIGNSVGLNRAIEVALQVAPTDLSVLITGESGTGKESFPQIIHNYSHRKHGKYIAVNCGAIPDGTIDSELFGHEKGSFTGAVNDRKGYFEEVNNGTIFLDEIGELPLSTQVRLLRVLETGEFMRVGSSKVYKTDVRVVAATNVNLPQAIQDGKFREDLFYRLNTVPIKVTPLRERGDDVLMLFRKFAIDFADKYNMPSIKLQSDAKDLMLKYDWPGNIRQLKNIAEQISIIESEREVSVQTLLKYLPKDTQVLKSNLPAIYSGVDEKTFNSEREILYQILFDMKNDMNDLKKLVHDIMDKNPSSLNTEETKQFLNKLHNDQEMSLTPAVPATIATPRIEVEPKEYLHRAGDIEDTEEIVEESLSLVDKEIELINKALKKHSGKRKQAAQDLGISERTLYRKIKEYNIS